MTDMILYHYTTLETLLAILNGYDSKGETFTLRATHALYLNDSQEGQMLPNVLCKIGIPKSVIHTCQNLDGYPYVFSLSKAQDDLNMWRGYANNACGVAIGFGYETLKECVSKSTNELDENELLQCEYITEEELYDKIQKESSVMELLSQVKSKNEYLNTTNFYRFLSKYMKYKSNAFSSEKEWRIIIKSHLDEHFRIARNTIVPYKEVFIPKTAISQITLGPKCDFGKTSFPIQRIFKKMGMSNVGIVASTIPFQ